MKLRASLAAVVALLLVAVAPQANGGGGTPITTCGQTVTTSAFLTEDLNCGGSDGVVVGADGITIDLKGCRLLLGDRGALRAGINNHGGYHKVTIKNGVVRNFGYGVWSTVGGEGLNVSDLVVSENDLEGISIIGDSAAIKSTTSSGNGGMGIRVIGVSTTIKSSTFSGNKTFGVHVEGAGGTIQSSTASRQRSSPSNFSANGHDGITVTGNAARIQSTTASGNGTYGIPITGWLTSIKSSTVVANVNDGVRVVGDAPTLNSNRADVNGFFDAQSDLAGLGINVTNFSLLLPPKGKNTGLGNDSPYECFPDYLC
jgi:hypothetical protein